MGSRSGRATEELLTAIRLPTAFRLRTMSGKPDGELASRNAQIKKQKISLVHVSDAKTVSLEKITGYKRESTSKLKEIFIPKSI
jgi:hypothetical protein